MLRLLLLDIGVMSIRTNKDWTSVALMGALLSLNKVTVLVNSAESKDKIDAGKAEQAFLEAQEQLDKAVGPKKSRSELCV
jgi:F0F1-type ATP synthase epsilon subunit